MFDKIFKKEEKVLRTYIFSLSADRVLIIRAENIHEAMRKVEDIYPAAFEDPFEVKIATYNDLIKTKFEVQRIKKKV